LKRRIRRLPHPPFAASAVCRIRRLPGFWRGTGFWWLLVRSGRHLARSAGAECGAVWYAGRDARHHTRLKRRRAR